MSIHVTTDDPSRLLRRIRSRVEDGEIGDWLCDDEGDFTLSDPRFRKRAWMRPRVEDERLSFAILGPRGETLTRRTYGVYHARFMEMLLLYFDSEFARVSASALATIRDRVA